MQIHIAKNKTRMGPYDISQVRQMIRLGLLENHDLYWHEGMLDWAPVAGLGKEAPLFEGNPNDPARVMPSPSQQAQAVASLPHGMHAGAEPLAVWSLVLGLLGLLCCGMLAGIPAIVCGHLALSNMNRNPVLRGRGQANAGLILGYLGSVLWIIFGITLCRR